MDGSFSVGGQICVGRWDTKYVLMTIDDRQVPSHLHFNQQLTYLLLVVGRVRQHGGHMEHDLVILVGGEQGVSAGGVG